MALLNAFPVVTEKNLCTFIDFFFKDSKYILKIKSTEFADRSDVRQERHREVKSDAKSFGLSK